MPTRCCVLDCKSAQNEPKRQTFPFPLSHPELVEKWIEALKFHQSQLTSSAGIVRKRICINHFTSDDLEKFHRLHGEISCIPLKNYKLKPDAVPSVFPGVSHPPIPNIAKQVSNEVPFYPNPDIYEDNFNVEKDPIALSANDFYVCQICEATENLIDISGDDKSHFRDELEKLKENDKMDLLQYLCQECGNKLMEISILRSQFVITYRKLIAKITPHEESTEKRVKEEAMEVAATEGTSGIDSTGEDEATDDISEMEYDDDDDGDLWEKMKKSKLKPDIFRKYPNMKCIVKAFDAANVCRIASLVKRAENSKNSRKYYSVKLKDRGFCCLKCDTILMNRHAVMMHKLSHDPQNVQNTKCNICNEEFCSPASTQRHIRVVHEKRKDYECGYCGKRFTERFEVRDHMERHHQGYRYECEMCQKTFKNKRSFNFHKKLHIPEEERTEKVRKVRKTPKKGQTSKLLERPQRQYICPTCGKIFRNQGNFSSHILIHDGKKSHECSVCAKRFLAKNSLKAHMKTHTGEKPYRCEICGNAFRQLGHLKFHLLTHTGEKPFQCPICNKNFTSNGNLTAHKLIHSGEKPLGCRMCEEKFGTYKALREHYRLTHFPDCDLPTGADIKNKLREVLGDD